MEAMMGLGKRFGVESSGVSMPDRPDGRSFDCALRASLRMTGSGWVVRGVKTDLGWVSARACGRLMPAASSRAKRLRAVEELVKVMASGVVSGWLKSSRMASMEPAGMTVR